jgi:hypothetical protein
MKTLNDGSRDKSPFQYPVHISLLLLTFTSSTTYYSSFSQQIQQDGNGYRLSGISKGLRKTWQFLVHSSFYRRLSRHCTQKCHYPFILFLRILPLTILAPLISSPLLESLQHYSRLIIPLEVMYASIHLAPTPDKYSVAIVSFSQ